MAVLVAYASRMGSTREIAEAIAARLAAAGLDVDLHSCADDPDPRAYAAVIIGSAIYVRRWLPAARAYLRRHRHHLPAGHTWFFESGPCGPGAASQKPRPPRQVLKLSRRLGSQGIATFPGRLTHEHATGRISRWMATGTDLAGDYRDFDAIAHWADGVARQLDGSQRAHT